MPILDFVRVRWDFLRALHPLFLFAESLPTVEAATQVWNGFKSMDEIEALKDEITLLLTDLRLNIIKQQLVSIDQWTDEVLKLEELKDELQFLLEELEDLVDSSVYDIEENKPLDDAEPLRCFPKLQILRIQLQNHGDLDLRAAIELKDDLDSTQALPTSALTQGYNDWIAAESSWCKRYSHTSIKKVASYIRFPREASKITSCRRTVSRFGMILDKLSGSSIGQSPDYTSQDVAAIQYAHEFASTYTSLFDQMVTGARCGTVHLAKLHLSGFNSGQLRMDIGTCREAGWISALFTYSSKEASPDLFDFSHICSHHPSAPIDTHVIHVAFNSAEMWEYPLDNSTISVSVSQVGRDQSTTLNDFLNHKDPLKLKYRKIVGVLLAWALFQLSDSPWIEQYLHPNNVFLASPNDWPLDEWCPLINCTLTHRENTKLQSDDIAAFGILVLELEADRSAPWTPADNDWVSGERSNQVRLARMLKDWEDVVSDDYRNIAKACLEFDQLVEILDHPDILSNQRRIAVIYKYVLEPLFRHLIKSFGKVAPLLEGMFGPWRSLTAALTLSPSNTAKWVLFDDDESLSTTDRQNTAATFFQHLQPFFNMIRSVSDPIISCNPFRCEKIRIAVLDSGIDDTDPMIRGAIKHGRINSGKSKSFIGLRNEWQDTHGHGTHVTRLLLQTAPAAEIYICKICNGKTINNEFLPSIAKAIDWAVDECNANIISISFGFEDVNESIDIAIDRAIATSRLVFAAASNNGGISGRTRPARREDVICIHATDGQCNKAGMNPTPMYGMDNFATLGIAVPSTWKGTKVWKSGTSFATPIAVGFAADILEFANHMCTNLTQREQKLLRSKSGMQAIFRKMGQNRDGYDSIHPKRLWQERQDRKSNQEAAKAIEDIVKAL